MAPSKQDRVFVEDGRRHYRRRYSLGELRLGAAIAAGLLLIAGWVAHKGTQRDPELFSASPGLVSRAEVVQGSPSSVQASAQPGREAADRGQAPEDLAPPGWLERGRSSFGPDNLYEKIDGREGFYKSFGFQQLSFLTLELAAKPEIVVDIELYDLGTPANALGAFSGELPAEEKPERGAEEAYYLTQNALFLARGRFYARVIGGDASEPVRSCLLHVKARLSESLPGAALPWSLLLFVDGMKLGAGQVSYLAESAFSFGFARGVHVGLLEDGETEVFAVLTKDEASARALAKQFEAGFLEYGAPAGKGGQTAWAVDRYLSRVSGARALGAMVLGVRGAVDVAAAERELGRLGEAVKALPPGTLERARELSREEAPPAAPAPEEGYR